MKRPFGVPALAGPDRLKAGLQTIGVPTDRFMVPMHGIKVVGAFHEPPGEGTGPTGCRPGPLTRRPDRFMVPMHAEKRKRALHEAERRAGDVCV